MSEEQAYKSVTAGNPLERSMLALCLMHNLDVETCLKSDGQTEDRDESQKLI